MEVKGLNKRWKIINYTSLGEGYFVYESDVIDLSDLSNTNTKAGSFYLEDNDGRTYIKSHNNNFYFEIMEFTGDKLLVEFQGIIPDTRDTVKLFLFECETIEE